MRMTHWKIAGDRHGRKGMEPNREFSRNPLHDHRIPPIAFVGF